MLLKNKAAEEKMGCTIAAVAEELPCSETCF